MNTEVAPVYSESERDQALAIFAMEAGRAKVVEAVLAEVELKIPIATIQSWAYTGYRDRYERIKGEVEAHARSQLADRTRRFAHLGGEVAEEALTQLLRKLEAGEIDVKLLPKVVREAAVAVGIGIEKSELLSGRPTARVSSDMPGLMRELKELGVEGFIDGDVLSEEDVNPDGSTLSQPPETSAAGLLPARD